MRMIPVRGIVIGASLLAVLSLCVGMGQSAERIPVIRQATEDSELSVAVEGYLRGDIFEVKVSVRIVGATPAIESVLLVGPKIGRMGPVAIKTVYATEEEEVPYETATRGAFISFGTEPKNKKLKGRVARKLAKFRVSSDKILPDKKYRLWVKVENTKKRGRIRTYKFDLDELPALLQR